MIDFFTEVYNVNYSKSLITQGKEIKNKIYQPTTNNFQTDLFDP